MGRFYYGNHYPQSAEERHAENLQGFPHGLPTMEADTINADPLTFPKRSAVAVTLNDLGRGQCRI
jgi:hypothetical protein